MLIPILLDVKDSLKVWAILLLHRDLYDLKMWSMDYCLLPPASQEPRSLWAFECWLQFSAILYRADTCKLKLKIILATSASHGLHFWKKTARNYKEGQVFSFKQLEHNHLNGNLDLFLAWSVCILGCICSFDAPVCRIVQSVVITKQWGLCLEKTK